MTTNVPSARPSSRPGEPTLAETKTMPVVTPTGVVGGVAVYDRDADGHAPSASMVDDRGPVEVRSTGSIMSWIIGAIVLIVLAYFLLQMIF